MLVVAVMSVALTAAGYAFIPDFRKGINELGERIEVLFAQAEQDGSGDRR